MKKSYLFAYFKYILNVNKNMITRSRNKHVEHFCTEVVKLKADRRFDSFLQILIHIINDIQRLS